MDFAILGPSESCTGDPARRMGNEYLFQAQAEQNVEVLNEAGVTKIVTDCPHCFNTLGNEYPDFGGNYEVVHHTELLADLVARGRARGRRATPARSPTTTPATWPATTTCAPTRASSSRLWARRSRWRAARSALLLRRRRRAHVDGGAWRPDQRGACPRGRRDRRRDARRGVPVLHGDARRRRERARRRAARRGRVDAACRVARARPGRYRCSRREWSRRWSLSGCPMPLRFGRERGRLLLEALAAPPAGRPPRRSARERRRRSASARRWRPICAGPCASGRGSSVHEHVAAAVAVELGATVGVNSIIVLVIRRRGSGGMEQGSVLSLSRRVASAPLHALIYHRCVRRNPRERVWPSIPRPPRS